MLDPSFDFRDVSLGRAQRDAAKTFAHSETPMLDARVLMKAVLQVDDAYLIYHENRLLSDEEAARFGEHASRRAAQEPIAHIIGEREFWGLSIAVEPGILVPRADSETLISVAVERRNKDTPYRVLDLGTGSGCLLCAMLASFENATGLGIDINEKAALLATRNLKTHGLASRSAMMVGRWAAAINGKFDIIVSNPPYIPLTDGESLPKEVVNYEDPRALFSGINGNDDYELIVESISSLLNVGGLVVMEVGDGHADSLKAMFEKSAMNGEVGLANDLKGAPRAIFLDTR